MRVNIYEEELSGHVEALSKIVDGRTYTGLRFYLHLPVTVGGEQVRGPFMHRPGDDDSSAVTFWSTGDLRVLMGAALATLAGVSAKPGKGPLREAVENVLARVTPMSDLYEDLNKALQEEDKVS